MDKSKLGASLFVAGVAGTLSVLCFKAMTSAMTIALEEVVKVIKK